VTVGSIERIVRVVAVIGLLVLFVVSTCWLVYCDDKDYSRATHFIDSLQVVNDSLLYVISKDDQLIQQLLIINTNRSNEIETLLLAHPDSLRNEAWEYLILQK
jgi:hypothetical protein